jgi:low temperature requirement protein LtrA
MLFIPSYWAQGFVVLMAVELAVPVWAERAARTTWHPHHVAERYGLFTIIVLGEGVVGAINGVAQHHHPAFATISQGVLGVVIAFLMWWTYFDFVARRVPKPGPWNVLPWSYGHMPLVMSIAAAGAATLNLVASEPEASIALNVRYLFAASVALMLCSVGFLETRLAPQNPEPTHPVVSPLLKVAAAILVLGLGFVPVEMPPWVYLLAVIGVLLINPVYVAVVWFRKPEAHNQGHYVG